MGAGADGGAVSALPRLYVIVDRATLDARGVGVGAFARELREAGVRLVQYRDKVSGPQGVLRGAAEVAEAFAGVEEAVLVMNDRIDLAVLLGWGVHVGQGDLGVGEVVRLLGERRFPSGMTNKVVGVSTHTEAEVREADAGGADYVAVGPVFGTTTKMDAEAVVGLEGVRWARALAARPLVAIGGITLENCASVIEAGADSVAVIGGMFVEGRTVGEVVRDFLARLG
jgi:thiamine-phosphate pyrophosphorylase